MKLQKFVTDAIYLGVKIVPQLITVISARKAFLNMEELAFARKEPIRIIKLQNVFNVLHFVNIVQALHHFNARHAFQNKIEF